MADDVPSATQKKNCTTNPQYRNQNNGHFCLLQKLQRNNSAGAGTFQGVQRSDRINWFADWEPTALPVFSSQPLVVPSGFVHPKRM
jgi:hypothetical protein